MSTEIDVVIERIANLKEYFQEEFKKNTQEHVELKEMLAGHDIRLRILENWKLVFVAKYSIYSGIALFFGAALANVAISMIFK